MKATTERGNLCLTRKPQEAIRIGTGPDLIVVRVVSIRGNKARLAIEANKATPISREELPPKTDAA